MPYAVIDGKNRFFTPLFSGAKKKFYFFFAPISDDKCPAAKNFTLCPGMQKQAGLGAEITGAEAYQNAKGAGYPGNPDAHKSRLAFAGRNNALMDDRG